MLKHIKAILKSVSDLEGAMNRMDAVLNPSSLSKKEIEDVKKIINGTSRTSVDRRRDIGKHIAKG